MKNARRGLMFLHIKYSIRFLLSTSLLQKFFPLTPRWAELNIFGATYGASFPGICHVINPCLTTVDSSDRKSKKEIGFCSEEDGRKLWDLISERHFILSPISLSEKKGYESKKKKETW
ncbi:hypothetical protein AVEN_1560-1 [Araneus ventricosus]|uniref:Uncharacterized protein n=1 Tax=Araneus ventricosus TaxID=182803 RepID=A0A4Y2DS03_ARAVE|nr:hypothetical protein AVEN_1560-1 [Araneus ventricosus]